MRFPSPPSALRAFAAALALAAGLGSTAGTAAAQDASLIRVGCGPDDQSTPLIYADRAGLFKKAGLNVELVKLGGGAAVAAAVAGGSLEVGKGSSMSVVTAIARGLPFTAIGNIGGYTSKNPDIALVVSAKSTINSPKELVGHTLAAVTLADMNSVATLAWLDQHGIDSQSLKYVEVPASAAVVAMEQGRIEGSTIYEPVLSSALDTKKVRVRGYPFDAIGKGKDFSDALMYASKAWVAQHPDLVEKFLKVVADASAFVAAHESQTAPLIAEFGGLDPATIGSIRHPVRDVALSPADIQPVIDTAAKYKVIPAAFPAQDIICACAIKR